MGKTKIGIHGVWMFLWGAWIASFLGWLLWAPQFTDHFVVLLGLRALFTIFLPLEIIGSVVQNIHMSRGEKEWATTLSQFMQRLHQGAEPGTAWWKSWNALVSGFTLVVAYAAGLAFGEISPVLGVLAALTIFWWNIYHWINSEKHG